MRPTSASPTGTLASRPERRTGWPSSIFSQSPNSAAPTLSASRLSVEPGHAVLELEHLHGEGVLEAVDARDAVADLEHGADLAQVRLDVEVLDSLLEDRGDLFRAEFHGTPFRVQPRTASSCLRELRRPRTLASARNEPAWSTMPPMSEGSTDRVDLDLPARRLRDLRDDLVGLRPAQRTRRDQLDLEHALLLGDEPLELAPDLGHLAEAPLLRQQAEEVAEDGFGVAEHRVEAGLLGAYVDLRVLQEPAELGRGLGRLDELGEVAADLVAAARRPSPRRTAPSRRCVSATAIIPTCLLVPRGEPVEVDLLDRLVDQPPLVVLVEHLARDLLRGDERQLDHLAADLLDEPLVLRLDRLAVLLEPPLEVGVRLLDRPLALRLADAAGLGEDLLGLRPVPRRRGAGSRRGASATPPAPCRPRRAPPRCGSGARRSDPGSDRTRAS